MAENDDNNRFKEFYYNTYDELSNKYKDILNTDQIYDVLKNIAKKFYETFKDSNIKVVFNDYTFNQYHSVRIMIDSSVCYQFPWDLYILVKDKIKIPDEILKFGFNYRLFFMHLYEYVFAIRKKLRPADVKMLQYLSKYEFYRDSELFYDFRRIAKFLKLDDSTIFKSISFLVKNKMFFDIYLLNPFKLGYLVKMFLYPTNQQHLYEILDIYTLFKMKMSNDYILHVVTLPNTINDLSILEKSSEYNIKTMSININLDQLQAKKEESFTNIPLWEQEKNYLIPHLLFTEGEYQKLCSDLVMLKNNNTDYIRISKYSTETQLERLTLILEYLI